MLQRALHRNHIFFPFQLFDFRIKDLRERFGDAMVRTPTYETTPTFANTGNVRLKTLHKLEALEKHIEVHTLRSQLLLVLIYFHEPCAFLMFLVASTLVKTTYYHTHTHTRIYTYIYIYEGLVLLHLTHCVL